MLKKIKKRLRELKGEDKRVFLMEEINLFWRKPYFWIIIIGIIFSVMWYFQILNDSSMWFVSLAFFIGLTIGNIFNVGVHFVAVGIPKLMQRMKTGIKYYSQFGQDKWVLEDIFDFKKGGYFLELGTLDGIHISNTYILEKEFGWKGILIEANDGEFQKLKSNRTSICVHACIDGSKKKIKFLDSGTSGRGGIIDKDTDNKEEDMKSHYGISSKETILLSDVLEKHNAPKVIDYFSIDVEGSEYRILKDFPFNKYKFLAMNVERPTKELIKLLRKNGYIKVGSNDADKYFIHEEFNKLKKL